LLKNNQKMHNLHKLTLNTVNKEIQMFNKEQMLFKLELIDKKAMTKKPQEELKKTQLLMK
jgi:hypothetical protein